MLRATVVPAREAAETTSNPKASIGPPAKLTVKPKGEGLASRRANRPATGAGLAAPGARNTTSLGLFGAPDAGVRARAVRLAVPDLEVLAPGRDVGAEIVDDGVGGRRR